MAKSNPRAIPMSEAIANPAGPLENPSDIPVVRDVLRDWRARRLDDDPAGMIEVARPSDQPEALIRLAVQRHSRGSLDRDEARQEAWLLYLTRKAVDGLGYDDEDLPARVVVVIRNHLSDLERRARRRHADSLTTEMADTLVGREEDPAAAYERARLRALVREILEEARSRISEMTHRIVLLRDVDGRSFEEIAVILCLPVARVRDRHRRAISSLRDLFRRRFADDPSVFSAPDPETEFPHPSHREVKP